MSVFIFALADEEICAQAQAQAQLSAAAAHTKFVGSGRSQKGSSGGSGADSCKMWATAACAGQNLVRACAPASRRQPAQSGQCKTQRNATQRKATHKASDSPSKHKERLSHSGCLEGTATNQPTVGGGGGSGSDDATTATNTDSRR